MASRVNVSRPRVYICYLILVVLLVVWKLGLQTCERCSSLQASPRAEKSRPDQTKSRVPVT